DIIIEDFGGGVAQEEIAVLKEKFKRGGNCANTEGAGLGLYISDYFMKEMQGGLNIENGEHGLKVTVTLSLSGKN
ncbi:MAG: sensor histidine kinase, partial [Clostridia bacterium]|nr:sensor histidine kinase [Clostridia bacterium]